MILNNEYKFIFIHIPKNAGTSLRSNLCRLSGMKQPYTFEEKAFARLCTHTKPCDCKKDGVLSGRHIRAITLRDEKEIDNWNDLYKFAFVRNPYDRMVSFWAFYRNIGTSMTNVRRSAEMMSFDDWVKYLRKKSFAKMGEHPESLVPPWRWPQVSWIEKDGKQIIDFVGRYENLQEDFEYICKHIGLDKDSSLWKGHEQLEEFNKSGRLKDYRQYYTEESKKIVGWWFKRDLELFDYSF